jgi:acetoacetate decarboxylase
MGALTSSRHGATAYSTSLLPPFPCGGIAFPLFGNLQSTAASQGVLGVLVSEHDWKFAVSPGSASRLVAPPPWHFSGHFVCADFRCDPARIAGFLPPQIAPDPDGSASLVFGDWVSASDADPRVSADPARGQYHETYVVAYGRYGERRVGRIAAIWVDNDLSLVRGLIQGFPKKLAQIHMTKEVTLGKAGARRAPGQRFVGHCSMLGARLTHLEVVLDDAVDELPAAVATPLLHTRYWPSISGGAPSVHELTRGTIDEFEIRDVYRGTADVRLFEHDYEELEAFQPVSVEHGYVGSVAFSITGGTCEPVGGRG